MCLSERPRKPTTIFNTTFCLPLNLSKRNATLCCVGTILPSEDAIQEAAADSEYTADVIEEAAGVIHDAVQSNLYEYYDSALNLSVDLDIYTFNKAIEHICLTPSRG